MGEVCSYSYVTLYRTMSGNGGTAIRLLDGGAALGAASSARLGRLRGMGAMVGAPARTRRSKDTETKLRHE